MSSIPEDAPSVEAAATAGSRLRRGRASAWLAWSGAFIVAAALLAATGYRSRDPDSALYAAIAARLAVEPVSRWIAPEWWGLWGGQGLFREHPAGIFLLPALLAKLGYPFMQAAYVANALYQIATIVLVQRLAAVYVSGVEARSLGWLLQLLPVAFVYRIRANHEQAVLLCVLAGLYGLERARGDLRWTGLTAAALVGLVLIKGVFAVFVPLTCAWLLFTAGRSAAARQGSTGRRWTALGLASVLGLAVALAYEAHYRQVTGESFLGVYLTQQLGLAAKPRSAWGAVYKLYNMVWYVARVVWFALPWSLVLVATAWNRAAARVAASPADRAAPTRGDAGAAAGLCLALGVAALYVAAFSLSDRKAERYIFPAYFFVGAGGGVVALRRWPAFRRLAERLDRYHPLPTVAVWLGTFGFSLLAASLRMPRLKIWAPE